MKSIGTVCLDDITNICGTKEAEKPLQLVDWIFCPQRHLKIYIFYHKICTDGF